MLSLHHLDCDGEYIHVWVFKEADAITGHSFTHVHIFPEDFVMVITYATKKNRSLRSSLHQKVHYVYI
jgi:hypothetical protein